MRVVKFRGLGLGGNWAIGNLSVLVKATADRVPAGSYISNSAGMPFAYGVRPETVGQFTGLLDKNGKEIYEGDILSGHDDGNVVVQWSKGNTGWICSFADGNCIGLDEMCIWFGNHSTVIGNIYEHHELLEVQP